MPSIGVNRCIAWTFLLTWPEMYGLPLNFQHIHIQLQNSLFLYCPKASLQWCQKWFRSFLCFCVASHLKTERENTSFGVMSCSQATFQQMTKKCPKRMELSEEMVFWEWFKGPRSFFARANRLALISNHASAGSISHGKHRSEGKEQSTLKIT